MEQAVREGVLNKHKVACGFGDGLGTVRVIGRIELEIEVQLDQDGDNREVTVAFIEDDHTRG